MIILSIKKKNNPRRSPTISITKLHFIRLWLKRITLLPVTTSRQCGLSLGGWSEGLLTGFLSWTLLPATWWLPEHPSTLSSGNQVCQSLEQPNKMFRVCGWNIRYSWWSTECFFFLEDQGFVLFANDNQKSLISCKTRFFKNDWIHAYTYRKQLTGKMKVSMF